MQISIIPRLVSRPKEDCPVSMDSKKQRCRKPRLDRRNANNNIEYDAASSSSRDSSSHSPLRASLLDLRTSFANQTSFRVEGIDGEVQRICMALGLSGPDDFAISTAAWEAGKFRSSSANSFLNSRFRGPGRHDIVASSSRSQGDDDEILVAELTSRVRISEELTKDNRFRSMSSRNRAHVESSETGENTGVPTDEKGLTDELKSMVIVSEELPTDIGFQTISTRNRGDAQPCMTSGIRGDRPPLLVPPRSKSLPVVNNLLSSWKRTRPLAPEDDALLQARDSHLNDESEEDEEVSELVAGPEEVNMVRLSEIDHLTGLSSFSASNDDDSSSTTTDTLFVVSPNGKFKRNINTWTRGGLLGIGSFGTVYEGLSDDGFFFAVKEVSLLDKGVQAQQCIHQLEQEIALLSQFEHENIVQYLGTDKEEAKLYIFLELVTKGSLASLYMKYRLGNSQVSSYTRQILRGLKYLHDRNVMHRDIKCANILVDANGSVKLADFGLAKETSKLNVLKSCKGSAHWMAPEVVNPRMRYGFAADIWSLGCTVLEMLTHLPPYSHLEWTQALFKIGQGIPPPVPDSLSRDARDFIHQCLQVVPDDRPTASELLEHSFVRTAMG